LFTPDVDSYPYVVTPIVCFLGVICKKKQTKTNERHYGIGATVMAKERIWNQKKQCEGIKKLA